MKLGDVVLVDIGPNVQGMQLPHEHERLLRLVADAFARADIDLQNLALDRGADDGPFDFDLDLGDFGLGLIDGRAGHRQIGFPGSGQKQRMFALGLLPLLDGHFVQQTFSDRLLFGDGVLADKRLGPLIFILCPFGVGLGGLHFRLTGRNFLRSRLTFQSRQL